LKPEPRSVSRSLRVFASTIDELEWLRDQLKRDAWIRDYAVLCAARLVPASFNGSWTRFVRYRVPTLRSDRKTGDEFGALRARRLRKAAADGMDYFLLSSASTSQRFTLIIERQQNASPSDVCDPNSYGFSTTTRPFSLPDVE
jgi:hypothetical protein